jgi:hypothetical protein
MQVRLPQRGLSNQQDCKLYGFFFRFVSLALVDFAFSTGVAPLASLSQNIAACRGTYGRANTGEVGDEHPNQTSSNILFRLKT